MAPDQSAIEAEFLKQEISQLSTDIQGRYAHHYHFHYLVFILLGAISAAFLGVEAASARAYLALATPVVMSPLVLLMLKEHAYIDLRHRYLSAVVRPRVLELIAGEEGAPREHILGWYSWEERAVRLSGETSFIYGVFGIAEYVLPVFVSVSALVICPLLLANWSSIQVVLWWCDAGLVSTLILIVAVTRLYVPHLPKNPRQ